MDKVLSHRAMNTLYMISAGILIVYIYELLISLCKLYLFVHTTNRIDVTLSDRLFKHLFRYHSNISNLVELEKQLRECGNWIRYVHF